MKRVLLVWLLLLSLLMIMGSKSPVAAQTYTCDACGYCQNGEPPSNWISCAQCLYDSNDPNVTLASDPNSNKAYTVFGCLELGSGCDPESGSDCTTQGAASFTNFFLNFFTTVIGGLAFLVMLFGATKVLMARGDPEAMSEGKRYVYGAILGLIVVASSVLIVKLVGGSLLQIPFLQ